MKPSDVGLVDPVPLTATFKRVETEVAAAYLLLAMSADGDTFHAVDPKYMAAVIRENLGKPNRTWLMNPFCFPDFDALIAGGWARWTRPDDGRASPIEFTDEGIAALQSSRWVRTPNDGGPTERGVK